MKILICCGTRPNFIKLAPLYHEGVKRNHDIQILHTGQHYDINLNQIFFSQLGIPEPNVNLNIERGGEYVKEIAKSVELFLEENRYDYIFVIGDVDSSLGCAVGAKNSSHKVVHIEAGLRSHDMDMPEERNRIEIDKISDIKFVSEPDGIVNLKNENLYSDEDTFLVGNVMIDTFVSNISNIEGVDLKDELDLEKGTYCIVTVHRPSNVDVRERLKSLLSYLDSLSKDIKVLFPIHPRTLMAIEKCGLSKLLKNIIVTEPLGYFEFLNRVQNARYMITDSGGAQEESMHLRIPCITIRSCTERPITLRYGTSFLAGEDMNLLRYYSKLACEGRLESNRRGGYELWDGQATRRIYSVLESL